MGADTTHLRQRGNSWYVEKRVPADLTAAFGKRHIVKALHTTDVAQARRLRHGVLDELEREFDRRRAQLKGDAPSDAYSAMRSRVRDMYVIPAPGEVPAVDPRLERIMESLEEAHHDHPEVQAIRDHIAGQSTPTELMEAFLQSKASTIGGEAVNGYRRSAKLWVKFAGKRPIELATSRTAEAFVGTLKGAQATKARCLRHLAALFAFAYRHHDDVPRNPFEGRVKVEEAQQASYVPFTDEELGRLLDHCTDDNLRSVILIALHSGLRLSEVLRAEREVVNGVECFRLAYGKTKSAARLVPVHSALANVQQPKDEKGNRLSVQFGRLKKAAGINDPRKVEHSLRKNFSTRLENAQVAEQIAARLLGHRMKSLSYGLYSGGLDVPVLQDAVEKVAYSTAVRRYCFGACVED